MRLEYFELIDRVEQMDIGALTIQVSGTLPEQSPVFDGHFPKWPVLPGVMMLEFMNHAAGYLLLRRFDCAKFVFLGGVKRAKFRRFVMPGDRMTVDAKVTHDGSGFAIAETTVWLKGEVAADAEVVMISTDFPTEILAAEIKRRVALIPVAAPASA
ncbi:3-hydroxyacyl-ACP dehydratase FabZ family protein [soil metagenome]